jgi:hypothetical protein
MFTKKRMLAGFLTLAMLLSLLTGMSVRAWAAEGDAQPPELSMWSPTDATVIGVDGQEYVIAPRYTEPDWTNALEPVDGFVTFEDLTPATAYTIFTRVKDGAGEPASTELTTDLSGIGAFAEDDYVVGAVIQGQIDPEDAKGLAYQWYYDSITVSEEGAEHHDYIPINGAREMNYTIQADDVGKYLAFKAFMDEVEVGVIDSLGPVLAEAAPADPTTDPDTACPKDDTCPISQFTDAQPGAWYHDGVHWALDAGLMNGMGQDQFAPNGTATRAMVVTMLWRMEGEPEAKAPAFTDVADGSWYQQPVGWAAENGIVTGTSATTFAPDASVTREQLVTILYRYAQSKGQDVSVGEDTNILSYDDASNISSWAMSAFQWACGAGIVSGVSQTALGPQNNATRAQIATMFQRFCASPDETVSHVFDFDGNQVLVTVDVREGWDAEFGEMGTYLYDRPNENEDPDKDDRDAAAYGVYETQEDYDTFLDEGKTYDNFALTDYGFTYTNDSDMTHFFCAVGNGVYFRVMVNPGYDPQEVFERFAVELLEGAPAN